jgi:hypothetical protein
LRPGEDWSAHRAFGDEAARRVMAGDVTRGGRLLARHLAGFR